MTTLSIDIGGTKFSMAVFEGSQMVARESRATDREGGREWMLAQILEIGHSWKRAHRLEHCGIGFGGPVDFEKQHVVLSTHVGGWKDFDLCGVLASELGRANHHGQRRKRRRSRRVSFRRGTIL